MVYGRAKPHLQRLVPITLVMVYVACPKSIVCSTVDEV